jgi:hypothetical protein
MIEMKNHAVSCAFKKLLWGCAVAAVAPNPKSKKLCMFLKLLEEAN